MSTAVRKPIDPPYFVDPDIRRAETLPASAFTSAEFLALELETLFPRVWLPIPARQNSERRDDPRELDELVRVRGSRVPFTLLDKPFFLQRGWKDSALRAFPNVCTHAWYPLVQGAGRGSNLVCAQHGRRFDCAGKFLSQPGFKDCDGFPRAQDHLNALPVEAWGPLMLTSLGAPAAPLAAFVGAADESVSRLKLGRLRRRELPGELREIDGNWKQHAWNYMDKFHISFIHKSPGGLADAIELASYRTELHELSALQWAYAKDPTHGFEPALLPERFHDPLGRRVFALWWFIFPNLALNFYPWGLSVNAYMPVPGKPEKTLFCWNAYSLDDAKFERRDELWLSDQVDREDVDAMAQARRGARSGFAPRGRFSPEEETGPHWYHRLVSRFVGGESAFGRIRVR